MVIRCLIIEDEPLAQNVIESYIGRINFLSLVGKCENADQAMDILQKEKIDLIFCDIRMPEITGIEFVKSLRLPPYVIFTTAFPEYALQGYEVDAVDFLLKPIPFERFLRSVVKVRTLFSASIKERVEETDFLFVKEDYKLVKVTFVDINYIEGMKDYARIFTKEKQIITHITLKRLEELLPSKDFIRTHKSFIVRLGAIKAIFGNMVELSTGNKIPIGLQYRDLLMGQFNNIN